MVNQKLAEYIVAKKQAGVSDETIRAELLANNWQLETINEALGVPVPEKSDISIPTPSSSHILGVIELFSVSLNMFKERFWNIVLIMLIPGLLALLVVIFFGIVYGALSVMVNEGSAIAMIIVAFVVLIIPFMIIQMWGSVALMTTVCSKDKLSFKEAYKQSWKKIMPFFTINFLIGCIVLGGSFLLIIPAIIFSIWFMFANYILITEDVKGFSALMRSREYVRGHWWMVVTRLVLVSLAGGLALIILEFLLSLIGFDSKSIPGSIFTSAFSFVTSVYSLCYFFQLFKNLKEVKGDFDFIVTTKSKIIYTIISIIGLIGIIIIPVVVIFATINPSKQIEKAKTSVVNSDKANLSMAITRYYAENSSYPNSLLDLIPDYLKSMPGGNDSESCFTVTISSSNGDINVEYGKNYEVICNQVTLTE